ncbi:10094_t:CDS:2, partial [Racocetra persica]
DYMPISINIDEIKNNLYNAINHYWPNLISPSSLLPSFLDPRYKNLCFVSFAKQFAIENLLHENFKKHTPITVEEISEYLKLEEIDIECDPF